MKSLKTFWRRICICLFITVTPVLMAQQIVTGRITDAADGTPVQDASIIIANTTIGTNSDESGAYSLTVPGRGSFEIAVTHVGYRPVFHKIATPQDSHQYNGALETVELDEIVVNAGKTYRQSDVNLFWRMILGETPSKRGMEVINEEMVYFYLNSDRVLKVTCREPVEIINHHTGYCIRYVLKSFEHDYRTGETVSEGMPYFEELVPRNINEQALWEKNRMKVYAVSLNCFLRALYREDIYKEGFLLENEDSRINGEPVNIKDFLLAGQGMVWVNIEEPLLLTYFTKPVTDQMILNGNWWDILGYETLVRFRPQQIGIYPDGTYEGTLSLGRINRYMGGLLSQVPIEYPDTTQMPKP